MIIPEHLLEKYNSPVPRYTSYPPANYFTEEVKESRYIEAVKDSNNRNPQNVSIYIHIPFCKKLCFYCGCNALPLATMEAMQNYVTALKQEIRIVAALIDKKRRVSQIHYGGGTPNVLPVEWIAEINELIYSLFELTDQPEIAIECNPAHLSFDYIDQLKKAGFNRFSIGIQDFNKNILKTVNRDPSELPVGEVLQKIKSGSEHIAVNLDFIYGLPGQTVESFLDSIRKAVDLRPDRLVTFSYAHVPWVKKAQKILDKIGLPDSELKMKMFSESHNFLLESGYKSIGLDHYVLESDELYQALQNKNLHRNFQGYCTRHTTGQVYAFGVSSISQLEKGYAQNTKSVKVYIESVNSGHLPVDKGYMLSDNEIIVREVINQLMCNMHIHWQELADRLNISQTAVKNAITYDISELKKFEDDCILQLTAEGLEMSESGTLFIRNVAASFDPLTNTQSKQFSKPV
jgi:oxygen-independent coproporphyrinogen III oxidase